MSKDMLTVPARVRALLRSERGADGLSIAEITELISAPIESVRSAMKSMPDAYIDRWAKTQASNRQYTGIWCVVVPPENCPKPGSES